ncbi:hypothetical protein [Sicyoidochytrium minutum DNA virus]|nr:hypothetical protein [Sicyoidochytrium minutum DNA virus]
MKLREDRDPLYKCFFSKILRVFSAVETA